MKSPRPPLPLDQKKMQKPVRHRNLFCEKLRTETPYPLKGIKGRVLVINFWATWCGPCHALEPMFARVRHGIHIESRCASSSPPIAMKMNLLVNGYLEDHKPHTPVVFADALTASLLSIPTRPCWSLTALVKSPFAPMASIPIPSSPT